MYNVRDRSITLETKDNDLFIFLKATDQNGHKGQLRILRGGGGGLSTLPNKRWNKWCIARRFFISINKIKISSFALFHDDLVPNKSTAVATLEPCDP